MVDKEDSRSPNINFFADKNDRDRLERVSRRLSLSKSEIARRALRLGLTQFESIQIPGGTEHTKDAEAS